MKSLYLIRHAKSDWSDHVDDFDRGLNSRGLRDAPFMADLLKSKINTLDVIYSSPAKRALTTAGFFASSFGFKNDEIITDHLLYLSSYYTILDFLREIDESYKKVALFIHNPAITELSDNLCEKRIGNVPTCGIVGLKLKVKKWKEINSKKCDLEFFEVPKNYF